MARCVCRSGSATGRSRSTSREIVFIARLPRRTGFQPCACARSAQVGGEVVGVQFGGWTKHEAPRAADPACLLGSDHRAATQLAPPGEYDIAGLKVEAGQPLAAVDKAYADRPDEGDATADKAA
ncbi:hypothetical protein ACFO3J_14460 [Streptomyces polygonati]|uniref:Uncharacterized protein n=1 Tax=Streptomyces polygonati TaxID=1617087 RepID=A0ABV8HNQ8_9ACTN